VQKVINCIVLVFLLLSICAATVQSYRLERNRRELEQVRNELECARDRTSDIRDSLRRTNEILSESRTTVQGIREQIAAQMNTPIYLLKMIIPDTIYFEVTYVIDLSEEERGMQGTIAINGRSAEKSETLIAK
jgi:hypothetical protein